MVAPPTFISCSINCIHVHSGISCVSHMYMQDYMYHPQYMPIYSRHAELMFMPYKMIMMVLHIMVRSYCTQSKNQCGIAS